MQDDDHKLITDGYNLTRSDHPSDSKKGGVCIYYNEHIPLINSLDTKIRSQSEKCFLTCAYRSPSQSLENSKSFAQILIFFLAR